MAMTSLGDLSTHFLLRRQNTALRTEMDRLGLELTTGQTTDKVRHLSGDFSGLSDIERRLVRNSAFRQAGQEATVLTDTMQSVLQTMQSTAESLGTTLVALLPSDSDVALHAASEKARAAFATAIAGLNTAVAGRFVFSGAATDQPTTVAAETILADVQAVVAGVTDPVSVVAAVEAWFTAPGGEFETWAYTGATMGLSPMQVAENESVNLSLRADHQALRAVLVPLALAAIAPQSGLSGNLNDQVTVLRTAGQKVFDSQTGLSNMRAEIGVTQARLEETRARLASENTALDIARNNLLSVDPYEAATRLEAAQFHLESLYTLTVRLSRLSLTEYM